MNGTTEVAQALVAVGEKYASSVFGACRGRIGAFFHGATWSSLCYTG
jgi:hypothetical protein